MKLEIDYIKDKGIPDKERIVFKVNEVTNLGIYVAAISKKVTSNSVSSLIKSALWLPDQALKPGDLVVLYTKKGAKSEITNHDGSTTYFYFWGLDNPLGAIDNSCVVLFESTWNFFTVNEIKDSTEK